MMVDGIGDIAYGSKFVCVAVQLAHRICSGLAEMLTTYPSIDFPFVDQAKPKTPSGKLCNFAIGAPLAFAKVAMKFQDDDGSSGMIPSRV
jgi:hypothetical protein